jgi:hypothetical protein
MTNARTRDNGSHSTRDQEPSEVTETEDRLSPTNVDMDSELESPLLSEITRTRSSREHHSMVDQEETSETSLESALMFTEVEMLTIDMSSSGTAIMDLTKDGASRLNARDYQSQHQNQNLHQNQSQIERDHSDQL